MTSSIHFLLVWQSITFTCFCSIFLTNLIPQNSDAYIFLGLAAEQNFHLKNQVFLHFLLQTEPSQGFEIMPVLSIAALIYSS